MASESAHFKQQKANNLNPFANGKAQWEIDPLLEKQKAEAFERATHELNSGIVQQLRLRREQQLASMVVDNCYKTGFTFPQAQKCEQYLMEKDFKLNMLGSFAQDHLLKHRLAYEHECHGSAEFNALPSIAEKDRHYAYCHNHFLRKLRQETTPELEVKAKVLFE